MFGGPYTTRVSPGTWLHPEVHRRIIPEASVDHNRQIVGYATGDGSNCFAAVGLIETIPITLLTLCPRAGFRVSFPLQRRLGIQNIERSGSLAHRSNSVAHLLISMRCCACVVLSSCNYAEEAS